jgi:MtN3 and saliva related transmembrane protein
VSWLVLIGSLAALASTASFVPQAWQIIKSRRTAGLSTGMYLLTVAGFALWTVYGLLLGAWPLILTNSVCLALASFILAMKLMPRQARERVADAIDPSVPPT